MPPVAARLALLLLSVSLLAQPVPVANAVAKNAWEKSPEWQSVQTIEKDLKLVERQIGRLRAKEPWILTLTLLTITLSLLTAVFAAIDKSWTPTATKICAAVASVLTLAQATFFRIDYFTCTNIREQAELLVSQTQDRIASFKNRFGDARHFSLHYGQIIQKTEQLANLNEVLAKSNITLVPGGKLAFVVFAQSSPLEQSNSQRILDKSSYDYVFSAGVASASHPKAAYNLAKFSALDSLARQALVRKELNPEIPLILYLESKASLRNPFCKQRTSGDFYDCRIEVGIPRIFLEADIVKRYQGIEERNEVERLAVYQTASEDIRKDASFALNASGKEGQRIRFLFDVEKSSDRVRVSARTLEIHRLGLTRGYLFRFATDGFAAQLPYFLLDNPEGHTVYDLTSLGRHVLTSPPSGRSTIEVSGYTAALARD